MIYSATSRRGGTGRTAVAALTSVNLAMHQGKSVCLIDLSQRADIGKILNVDRNHCVDSLISVLGFDNNFVDMENCIIDFNGLDIILGTKVDLPKYLYKRASKIKALLEELDKRYDIVIADVDYDVHEELVYLDTKLVPIHVLTQNMLVIEQYQDDIRNCTLDGYVIVNSLDSSVLPDKDLFTKNLDTSRLFFLDRSPELMTELNKNKFNLNQITKTSFYRSLEGICLEISRDRGNTVIAKKKDDVDTLFGDGYKITMMNNSNVKSINKKKTKKFDLLSFFKFGGVKNGKTKSRR